MTKTNVSNDVHVSFYKNHFISSIVLDSLKFEKLLALQGKSQEALDKNILKSFPGLT